MGRDPTEWMMGIPAESLNTVSLCDSWRAPIACKPESCRERQAKLVNFCPRKDAIFIILTRKQTCPLFWMQRFHLPRLLSVQISWEKRSGTKATSVSVQTIKVQKCVTFRELSPKLSLHSLRLTKAESFCRGALLSLHWLCFDICLQPSNAHCMIYPFCINDFKQLIKGLASFSLWKPLFSPHDFCSAQLSITQWGTLQRWQIR